jgi:hypothetical protein
MGWVDDESLRLFCPCFADGFVGSEPLQGLQAAAEIIGADEVIEMGSEIIMGAVVEALYGGVLDRAVHSFDLPISPWMTRFC